jgi:AcrR family transcriptional regulator
MSSAATRTMRRRQREESRQAILDAAERRLRAAPFHALSVDALMSDTGLSRTLFYRHFADLPDVVLQLLRSVGGELMEIGEGWVRAGASEPIGRESVVAIVDFFARNGTLIRAITDAARYDPEIDEVYGAVIERFVEMTADAMAGLRFEGDARETARALTAMNEQYLLTTFGRTPPAAEPERAVDALWSVWQRTIYAEHEE